MQRAALLAGLDPSTCRFQLIKNSWFHLNSHSGWVADTFDETIPNKNVSSSSCCILQGLSLKTGWTLFKPLCCTCRWRISDVTGVTLPHANMLTASRTNPVSALILTGECVIIMSGLGWRTEHSIRHTHTHTRDPDYTHR